MAGRCGPRGRFQVGDAVVWAGADGATERGGTFLATDPAHAPQRGAGKGGGRRRRTGDEVAPEIRGRGREMRGLPRAGGGDADGTAQEISGEDSRTDRPRRRAPLH